MSVMWKVMRIAHSAGLFDEFALSFPAIKRLLKIKIDTPIVQSRDRNIETNRLKILNDSGLMSDETWSNEEGLDREQELSLGAERRAVAAPFAGGDKPGAPVENQSREPQAGNLGTAERNVPVEKKQSAEDPPAEISAAGEEQPAGVTAVKPRPQLSSSWPGDPRQRRSAARSNADKKRPRAWAG